jgi:glyoxylase I family protein
MDVVRDRRADDHSGRDEIVRSALRFRPRRLKKEVTMPVTAPPHQFISSVHGIRYQVKDVARAAAFYTEQLGFTLGHQQLPAFAAVSLGDVAILLSGPWRVRLTAAAGWSASGAGGWNRVVLRVSDLAGCIDSLKSAGVRFRNEMESAPAVARSRSRIRTAIRSSCLNRRR